MRIYYLLAFLLTIAHWQLLSADECTGVSPSTFAEKVDFSAGLNPHGITTGDLDGDGKNEIIVTNRGQNTVAIYHNTSTSGTIDGNSFTLGAHYDTENWPWSVDVSDLDGDGDLEIAVVNGLTSSVSIYKNTASSGSIEANSFSAPLHLAIKGGGYDIDIGDLSGDGIPDIATANWGYSSASILKNTSTNGSLTFATHIDLTVSHPFSVSIADLDGDGKSDLALGGQDHGASIFRNTATDGAIDANSFAPPIHYSGGANPYGIAVEDFDGDGKPDLALGNNSSANISIYKNTSTPGTVDANSFAPGFFLSAGACPDYVRTGDVDGDGRPDIVMTNFCAASVSVYNNLSSPNDLTANSFAYNTFATNIWPVFLALDDLDSDSKLDIAVANRGSNNISLLHNTSSCTFTPPANNSPTFSTLDDQTGEEGENLTFSLMAWDPDFDRLTFSSSGLPTGSSLTANSFSWTPSTDQAGSYSPTFTVSDGKGGTVSKTVAISIAEAVPNQAPTLYPISTRYPDEGGTTTLTLAAVDPEGDTLTFSMSNHPEGATLSGSNFLWEVDFNHAGTHHITFTVQDQYGGTDTQTATFIVKDINRRTLFSLGNQSVNVEAPLTIDLSLYTSDPDGDPLSYTVFNSPSGSALSANTFTWTPSSADIGDHTLTFTADDGKQDGSFSRTITITVAAPNHPPTFANIDNPTITEGQQLSLTLNATDPDGDTLTYSTSNNPSGSSLSGATFTWTPSTTQAGSYTPTFTASDGKGGTASQTMTITVTNLNQAPTLSSITSIVGTEGNPLTIALSGSDPDGDALNYSMNNSPSGSSLSGNTFSWTPSSGQAGSYSVTFTTTDPSGATASQTATITVQTATAPAVNNAPSLSSTGEKSVTEGSALSFILSGSDPDGDILTYSMINGPSGSSLSGNTFSWTPSSGQVGSYPFTFTATDPSGATASQTTTITVQVATAPAVNNAPSLAGISGTYVIEGNPVRFELNSFDPDGDILTYSMSNDPSGSTLSGNIFSWTPSSGQAGRYSITFTATDPSGATASQTTIIRVVSPPEPNSAPHIRETPNTTIRVGQQLALDFIASDSDLDPLTYSISDVLEGSTFNSGRLTWTPKASHIGSYSITVTASDRRGGTSSTTTTITVKEATVIQANTSTALLDFGEVLVGETKTLTAEINNTGDVHLSSFPIIIFGEGQRRFSTTMTRSSLFSNSTSQIPVSFTPTETGTSNAILSVDYSSLFFEIALVGKGVVSPAKLALEKTAIDFGRGNFANDSTASLWITNTGQDSLQIESSADSEHIVVDPTQLSIARGDTGYLAITYRRLVAGDMSASLSLHSNDPEQAEVTIAISGYTTHPPLLRQTPADTLDFGDVSVGETRTKSVRIENSGEEDISDTLSISGTVFSSSSSPVWNASGLTFADYALDFSPNHLGEFVGELKHRSNSFTVPQQTLVLKGRGLHGFRPERTQIAFDTLFTGQSTTDTLLFTNHTSKKLNHSFELPRTNFFRIDTTGTASSMPSQQLKIPITFNGNRPGAFSFETTIKYASVDGSPLSYKQFYSGSIRPSPQLSIRPDTLDLGAVRYGQTSSTRDLLLENTGAATLHINQVVYSRNEYYVANEDSLPFVLEPGQSRALHIASTLKEEGLSERLLVIYSNDPLHERSEVLLRADGKDSTFFRTPIKADFAFDLDGSPGLQDSTEAIVQTGDLLTLSLYTSAVKDLVGFNARVHYDASQVELVQVSEKLENEGNVLHQSTGTSLFLPITNESAGQSTYGGILLSPGPNNSVHRGGLLAAWKFKVKEGFTESGKIRLGQVALRSVTGQDTLTQDLSVQLRQANVGFSPISMDLDPAAGNQELDQIEVSSAERLTLQFHLDGLSQINGYGLRLEYDPTAISLDLRRFQIDTQGRVALPVTRQIDDDTVEIGAVAFSQAGLNPSFLGSLPIALNTDFIGETTIHLSRITLNFPNRPDRSITVSKEVVIRTRKTSLPSDFNGDGVVNIADFFLFTDALGQANPDPRFDLNEDGQLDFGDFFIFIDQFSPQRRAKLISLAGTNALPRETTLYPNYPNPFNAQTIIRFALTQSTYIELALYDIQGQLVRQFIAEQYPAGISKIAWDGADTRGHRLASGVYILSLHTAQLHFTRKILLLR